MDEEILLLVCNSFSFEVEFFICSSNVFKRKILSFIWSIGEDSYYEYDLISGSSTHVSALLPQTTYKFYIPALVVQKVDIQITITDSSYTSNQYYNSLWIFK